MGMDKKKLGKILLVDDNQDFRVMLKDFLISQNFEVSTAGNGKEAENMLSFSKYDLIISDIKMPEMNGVELLHRIKDKIPDQNVVLMTGFSDIMETEEAYAVGANDFIAKPFNFTDLMTVVYKFIKPVDHKEEELEIVPQEQSDDFFAIPIDDFLSGSTLKYDLYIKLGESKFIKLANVGTVIDKERLEAYKNKGAVVLYVGLEDYKDYMHLNITLSSATGQRSKYKNVTPKIIGNVSSIFGNLVFKKAIDEKVFNETKGICTQAFRLIEDNDDLVRTLESIKDISDAELLHSTAVSFVASLIARSMKWNYGPNVYKLLFASMLHDVGKKVLPRSIIDKMHVAMTNAEIKEYQKHVNYGRDMILEIKTMHSDVAQAVYEHHETFNGVGFPNEIKGQAIHPLARVIRIADDFCNYMYPKEDGRSRSLPEVLKLMSTVKYVEYDPKILQSFLKNFRI
jgi:response regulator RpfG family c-di-GMP phosphodiesterase